MSVLRRSVCTYVTCNARGVWSVLAGKAAKGLYYSIRMTHGIVDRQCVCACPRSRQLLSGTRKALDSERARHAFNYQLLVRNKPPLRQCRTVDTSKIGRTKLSVVVGKPIRVQLIMQSFDRCINTIAQEIAKVVVLKDNSIEHFHHRCLSSMTLAVLVIVGAEAPWVTEPTVVTETFPRDRSRRRSDASPRNVDVLRGFRCGIAKFPSPFLANILSPVLCALCKPR
ncbi:hypothetical protein J6590_033308 [Homalodisca vitripennis]|nr:hypothetical protein J6590_033308 [Homalodisca vitripennis]